MKQGTRALPLDWKGPLGRHTVLRFGWCLGMRGVGMLPSPDLFCGRETTGSA